MKPVSPYYLTLQQLTNRALNAMNRAIETELTHGGWSWRTRAAWKSYDTALLDLGRITQIALEELDQAKHVRKAS